MNEPCVNFTDCKRKVTANPTKIAASVSLPALILSHVCFSRLPMALPCAFRVTNSTVANVLSRLDTWLLLRFSFRVPLQGFPARRQGGVRRLHTHIFFLLCSASALPWQRNSVLSMVGSQETLTNLLVESCQVVEILSRGLAWKLRCGQKSSPTFLYK